MERACTPKWRFGTQAWQSLWFRSLMRLPLGRELEAERLRSSRSQYRYGLASGQVGLRPGFRLVEPTARREGEKGRSLTEDYLDFRAISCFNLMLSY